MQGPMPDKNGLPPPASKNSTQHPRPQHYPHSGPGGLFPGPHGPPGKQMMQDGYWEPPPNERGPPPPPEGGDGSQGKGHAGEHSGNGEEHSAIKPDMSHRPICRHFQLKGYCRYGEDCAFYHLDMSNKPICRHFQFKGYCRYEENCAFYHPGINGPPLL